MLLASAATPLFALDIKGVQYISIAELARICGMRYKSASDRKSQTVFSKITRMDFTVNSRQMELNGRLVWLGHPVASNRGMLYLAKRDYLYTIAPILVPQKNGTPPRLFHIVLDPGHGGKDNGAMNSRYRLKEKNVNLDISLRVGKILKANGYRVSYTRTNDTFIELEDRTKIANKLKADLFLSIHCNAASPSASGIETFSLTPSWMPSTGSTKMPSYAREKLPGNKSDLWNQLLSYYIQRSLKAVTRAEDRGVKRARFAVLRDLNMTGALIECGFITNPTEGSKLGSAKYRQSVANAIANAIMSYHSTLRRLAKSRK